MNTPLDLAFRALSHPERRQLLLALEDRNSQTDASFAYLDEAPFAEWRDEEGLHVRMHHTHLPMLEQAGFIEWDQAHDEVTIGPNYEVVRPFLSTIDKKFSSNRFGHSHEI